MANKTKKELMLENNQLKKYLTFWVGCNVEDLDIKQILEISNHKKRQLILLKKILISLSIIILCLSCFILGLGWC